MKKLYSLIPLGLLLTTSVNANEVSGVTTSNLKTRQEPNKQAAVVLILKEGRHIKVLESVVDQEGETWYKTRSGYVFARYVRLDNNIINVVDEKNISLKDVQQETQPSMKQLEESNQSVDNTDTQQKIQTEVDQNLTVVVGNENDQNTQASVLEENLSNTDEVNNSENTETQQGVEAVIEDNSTLVKEKQPVEESEKTIVLKRLINDVVKNNTSALYDKLERKIAQHKTAYEASLYEPTFTLEIKHNDIDEPNTVEQSLSRGYLSDYIETSNNLDMGLSGLSPIGTEWNLKFSATDRTSNTIEQFKSYSTEYNNALNLTLKQPILKGFGRDITEAKVTLAKIDEDISASQYTKRVMDLVGSSIEAYWKLYGAEKLYETWQNSLQVAESMFEDIKNKIAMGKVAQTEAIEAQSGILVRQSEIFNARSKMVDTHNQILSLLNQATNGDSSVLFSISESLEDEEAVKFPTLEESYQQAVANWPEFQSVLQKIEKEKVQVAYAQDQTRTQLDAIGNIRSTSLDSDSGNAYSDAFSGLHKSWYLGLQLTVPLFGNEKAENNLLISKLKLQQAQLELSTLKNNLTNSIHTRIEHLKNSFHQMQQYKQAMELKVRLVEVEKERLKIGKTSIREVLKQEEDMIDYQRKYLSALIDYKLAQVSLDKATGTLLAKYDLSIEKQLDVKE